MKVKECNDTQSRTRGFTLVELLVVMAILSVLAGIGVGGYLMFFQVGEEAQTTSLQSQIRVVLNNMNGTTGYYPPSVWSKAQSYAKELRVELKVPKIPDDQDANAGNEILYALIEAYEPLDLEKNMVKDTDGDGLLEFTDAWLNPMVYMNADDARTVRTMMLLEADGGGYQVMTYEPRHEEGHSKKFEGRYQLVSAGIDAEFHTDDDLVQAPRR